MKKHVDPDQLTSSEASWSWFTLFLNEGIEKLKKVMQTIYLLGRLIILMP